MRRQDTLVSMRSTLELTSPRVESRPSDRLMMWGSSGRTSKSSARDAPSLSISSARKACCWSIQSASGGSAKPASCGVASAASSSPRLPACQPRISLAFSRPSERGGMESTARPWRQACTSPQRTSRSIEVPGQVLGAYWLWKTSACSSRPNLRSTARITARVAFFCGPAKGSCPASKLPTTSMAKGPAWRLPLRPRMLAGGWSKGRPVQSRPPGSTVRCWAMSAMPACSMW